MGWGSVEDPELEEGEAACYYKDDDDDNCNDESTDPDIALSYIGEKLQNVLGHFQKDFEGGVSAEHLGAKFGCYGSFLPMYQRSPLISSHPKTPPRAQYHSTSKSTGELPKEGGPPNLTATIDAPVFQTRGTSDSCSAHLLNNSKSSSVDGFERQGSRLVAGKISPKHEPFGKSVNPPDKKKLTVRIKVRQKNAAIYSGLGLTSPSSSMGNSPGESCGTPFPSREIPSESPDTILQSFTSFPVFGDLLLSPLHERILDLITSGKDSIDTKLATSVGWHGNSVRPADNPALLMRTEEVVKGKKSKSIEMGESFVQTKHEKPMHPVDIKGSLPRKISGSDSLDRKHSIAHEMSFSGQSLKNAEGAPESVRKQQQHDIPVKKREIKRDILKDLVKGESLNSVSVQDAGEHEQQEHGSTALEKIGEIQVKCSQRDATLGNGVRVHASVKTDSDRFGSKLDTEECMDHLKQKRGKNIAFHEHDKSGISSAKKGPLKNMSSEGKKKLKGSKTYGNRTSGSEDGAFKSGVHAAVKDKKSALKNVIKVRDSYKDLLCTRVEHVDSQVDQLERPHGDKLKDSSREGNARKQERPGFKRSTDQVVSEISLKGPMSDGVPPTNGMVSGVQPVPAPILIEENWVCCDRCQKWRLLPYGTKPEHLPDKWLCSMLNWLPGMNRCDITEDETTKALHALYQIPPPETQNNLQDNADVQHSDQIHQNIGSHYMTHQGKKKSKSNETSRTSTILGPIMNSNLTKPPQQELGKSRSLKDRNELPPESNPVKKTNAKHLKNSYNAVEKHPIHHEENRTIKGDAKLKPKIKRERESDQYGQGSVKRIKTDGAVKMNSKGASECDGHPGKIGVSSGTGLPSKAALTENKESHRPRFSIKKSSASLQGSMGSASIDVMTHDETGKSLKRRKLIDYSDGQDHKETMQSNGNVQDTKVSVEDSGDSELRAEKKLSESESQGKNFRKTKGATGTRLLLSGSIANTVGQSLEKAQQMAKFNAKMAPVTLEDIEALKKDLVCELPLATAATSSSSKISDTRKRRKANYLEVKGSPVDSISSSPMRTSEMNILPKRRMTSSGKDELKFGDFASACSPRGSFHGDDISESNQSVTAKRRVFSAHPESFDNVEFRENNTRGKGVDALSASQNFSLGNKERVSTKSFDPMLHQKKFRTTDKVSDLRSEEDTVNGKISSREDSRIEQNPRASFPEVVGNSKHPFCDDSSVKACRPESYLSKRDLGKRLESVKRGDAKRQNQPKHGDDERVNVTSKAETANEIISTQEEARSGKMQAKSRHEDKHGLDASGRKVASESQKGSALHVLPHDASPGGEALKVLKTAGTDLSDPNDIKKEASTQSASSALREAEELRNCADRLKDTGFGFECNEAYFQAALMFLHGASLLESTDNESNKHGEMSQMQIYSTAAKICETCAVEYENRQEMAAAALAYKCTEVAFMRVANCKNGSASRAWHDLQASILMIPQGDSPSSSASDIDNLNNQVALDKAALGKGNGSLAGNHINGPQNRHNFVRLLDFAKDVDSALEASIKCMSAFEAVANMTLEPAQKKALISSVKRALEMSFYNVEELVRLVRHAFGAISRRGFSGS